MLFTPGAYVDTFASRIAARLEKDADAAIWNVTGSNSVNVFLGLGIAWTIAALYHVYSPNGKGVFRVDPGSMKFSVILFTSLALVAILLLLIRRFVPMCGQKGELGGTRAASWISALFLILLWVVYVILSTLEGFCIILH